MWIERAVIPCLNGAGRHNVRMSGVANMRRFVAQSCKEVGYFVLPFAKFEVVAFKAKRGELFG